MPILTAEERVGTNVGGKYHLDRILGRGGMATVFEATHVVNGRKVAVKLLHPEFAVDAEIVRRFVTEARASAAIDHPNAVSVLDTGQDADSTPYLVLELLRGETLAQHLARLGRLSYDEVLSVAGPVLDALAAAHARGIVHRDIKPDNVFLAADARGHTTPKLLDFGIAKVMDATRTQTATGQALGTPYYMSPEQVEGKGQIGPPSDVWSMGVVLYQCLTGELPFHAPTLPAVFVAILTTRPPSVAQMGTHVSPAVAAVIDRTLARDPAARFQTANELASALAAAAHVRAPKRKSGRGGMCLLVTLLGLVVVLGGAGAAYAYQDRIAALIAGLGGPVASAPPQMPVAVTPLSVAGGPSDVLPDAGVAVAPVPVPVLADAGVAAEEPGVVALFEQLRALSDAGLAPGTAPQGPLPPTAVAVLMQLMEAAQAAEASGQHPPSDPALPAPPRPQGDAHTPDRATQLRIVRECHQDPTCIVEGLRGQAMTEPEIRALIEAYRASGQVERARAPLQRYLDRFPDSPHAGEYRRLLAQGASRDPALGPPRRRRPSGVH